MRADDRIVGGGIGGLAAALAFSLLGRASLVLHAEGPTRELATGFLQGRSQTDSFKSLAWLYDHDPGAIRAPGERSPTNA